MTRVVTQLVVDARPAQAGAADYEAAMRRAQAGIDRVLEREAKLQGAIDQGSRAFVSGARLVEERSRAFERYRAAADPAVRAQQALERATQAADAALRRGATTQEEASRIVGVYRQRHEAAAAAAQKTSASNDNFAGSVGRSTGALQSQLNPLSDLRSSYRQLTGLVVGLGIAYAGREFVQVVTTFQAIEASMKAATGSTAGAQAGLAFVRSEADRLGLTVASTAKDFAAFTAATRGTDLEGEKTRKVFSAIAEAGTVLGLSADDMSGSLRALTQMASKGTVQSEELRGQLGDRLPGAFNIAAKSMGVTTAEFGKMLETGQVIAVDFLPKFADEMHKTFGPDAAKASDNLRANINRLGTSITDLYLAAGKGGLTDALNDATKQATAFLKSNQDTAASVGGALATGLRTGGQAFEFLRRNADLAGTALAAIIALRYGPTVAGIAVETARAAAMMGVYSVETRGLVVSQTAAVASSRALSVAMGALGGPVGIALTAAAAGVAYLALHQDEATKAAEAQAAGLKQLDTALAASKGSLAGAADDTKRLAAEQIKAAETAVQVAQARLASADALAQAGQYRISFGPEDQLLGGAAQAGAEQDAIRRAEELGTAKERLAATLRYVAGNASEADRALLGLPGTMGSVNAVVDAAIPKLQTYGDALAKLIAMAPQLQAAVDASAKAATAQAEFNRGTLAAEKAYLAGEIGQPDMVDRKAKIAEAFKAAREEVTGYSAALKKVEGDERNARYGGMEGRAGELAKLKDQQADYVKSLSEGATTAMTAAQRNELVARSEAVLAQNVANTNKKYDERAAKAAASGSGSDAYDNALQRSKDQITEFQEIGKAAGRTTEEVYKLAEANRLRRAAASAGRADEAGIAGEIERQADAYAQARIGSDRLVESQRRVLDAQREVGQEFGQFAEDILLGSGRMDDAFKSLAKTFASNSLKAILTGEGGLAGAFGTSPTERGGLGGVLGMGLGAVTSGGLMAGKTSLTDLFDFDKLTKSVTEGTSTGAEQGTQSGLSFLMKGGQGFAGYASAIMPVAAGGAAGFASGSPVAGALTGGLAGLASGNPVMALAGAAAGLLGGLFGKSEAEKAREAEKKQAAESYRQAQPQIQQFRAGLRGEGLGGTEAAIRQAQAQFAEMALAAQKAGDFATAAEMQKEMDGFAGRARATVARTLDGTLEDFRSGFGTGGAFTQAAAGAREMGEAAKGLISDAAAVGRGAEARRAAVEGMLANVAGSRDLSEMAQALDRIQGAAAGTKGALMDLGLSAEHAGRVVRERAAKALDDLRASFRSDLQSKINDARGQGYLNDVGDAVKERQTGLADAKALGLGTGRVEQLFTLSVQKIVNEAGLTGSAFDRLVRQFPVLKGKVEEFGQATETAADRAAKAAEALARRQGYADRLFAARNDETTLGGQLAAFERQARQERLEEQRAGGQAMAALIKAQNAERLAIQKDYAKQETEAKRQAAEEQKRVAQDAKDFLIGQTRSIRQYLDSLTAGSGSPLSPGDRLDAATSQFNAQYLLAKAGDRDALSGITGYSSNVIDAGKAQYASGPQFQALFKQMQDALAALPKQVSSEQFIANAVNAAAISNAEKLGQVSDRLGAAIETNSATAFATALNANFDRIDVSKNGVLTTAELKQALGPLATSADEKAALDYFRSVDLNGNGVITKLEAVRFDVTEAVKANSPAAMASALQRSFDQIDTNKSGSLSLSETLKALAPLATKDEQAAAKTLFAKIDANGNGTLEKAELIRAQAAATATSTAAAAANALATKAAVDAAANSNVAGLTGVASTTALNSPSAINAAINGNFSGLAKDASVKDNSPDAINGAISENFSGLAKDSSIATVKTSVDGTKNSVDLAKGSVDTGNLTANASRSQLALIKTYTDATRDGIKIGNKTLSGIQSLNREIKGQNQLNSVVTISGQRLSNNNAEALNKIVFNTAQIVASISGGAAPFAFASGGYTGPGGVYDPAGVVHKGEIVWSQANIARAGGVAAVEAMRLGMRGYADGGLVRSAPMPVLPPMVAMGGEGALVAELRALRREVGEMRREAKDTGEMNGRMTKQAGEQSARASEGTTRAVLMTGGGSTRDGQTPAGRGASVVNRRSA